MLPVSFVSSRDPLENSSSTYSIGTAYAIDGLEAHLMSRRMPSPTALLVNINTLVRNYINVAGSDDLPTMTNAIRAEVFVMVEDLVALFHRYGVASPGIVLYMADYYKSMPDDILRPSDTSKTRAALRKAVNHAIVQYQYILGTLNQIPNSTIMFYLHTGKRTSIAKALLPFARKVSPVGKVFMLSHVPLDYHLHAKVNQFAVVESHTGMIREAKALGKKVFKRDNIPFNPTTHALLGDKEYIAPSLSIKERRLLYATAEKERWEIKTTRYITASIKKLGLEPKVDLS